MICLLIRTCNVALLLLNRLLFDIVKETHKCNSIYLFNRSITDIPFVYDNKMIA